MGWIPDVARLVAKTSFSVGTRGSKLALVQAELVIDRLKQLSPRVDFEPRVITTTGDRSTSAQIGEGVFVKEIQRALARGEIDIAVHSLKDLPTQPAPRVVIAAIPPRADPRDALVGARLDALAEGARVGTGSPRRAAQLRRLRPDLEVLPVRGNVGTRIEKVRAGEFAAVMLAVAGLSRLGLEPDEAFDPEVILPAPGQGALAVETREDDEVARELVAPLEDPETRAAVIAERAVLWELGGGCMLPVATYARIEDGALILSAAVVSSDGAREARAEGRGDLGQPEKLARQVADRLIEQEARALL